MLHPVVPAVVCGISAVGILITVVLLCRHLRKRKHRTCVSTCGYDAIGDCKPPSLMSVTPSTSQVSGLLESWHEISNNVAFRQV